MSAIGYDKLKVSGGKTLTVTFEVQNTGQRPGTDIPQVYLTSTSGSPDLRLIGFSRASLEPCERRTRTLGEAIPRWVETAQDLQLLLFGSWPHRVTLPCARPRRTPTGSQRNRCRRASIAASSPEPRFRWRAPAAVK
jgi:hypothetical protein